MASVLSTLDPSQNQNQNQQGSTTLSGGNQPTQQQAPQIGPSGAGAAAGAPSVASGGGGATGAKPATAPGGFQNLQKYLSANQNFGDNPGGFAGQVVGNVTNQANQAQQNIQGASNAFNTGLQQNVSGWNNPTAVQNAFANPSGFVGGPQTGTQFQGNTYTNGQWNNSQGTPLSADQQTAINNSFNQQQQNNLNQFRQAATANYGGPQSLNDLSGNQSLPSLQLQSSNLTNTANQAQTEPGRFNMLQQMFGNTGYTQGQQNLDNLLLQSNPQQMQQLQGLRSVAGGVQQNLNAANIGAVQQAQAAQAQAQTQQAAINQQLQGAITNEQTQLQNQAIAGQNALTAERAKDYSTLAAGQVLNDQNVPVGVQAGAQLWGLNLGNYLTPANQLPTLNYNQTATPQDVALMGALSQMSANPALAGYIQQQAMPTNPITFDTGAFNNAVAQQKNAFQTALAGPNSPLYNQAGIQSGGAFGPGTNTNTANAIMQALEAGKAYSGFGNYSPVKDMTAFNNLLSQYGMGSATWSPSGGTAGTLNIAPTTDLYGGATPPRQ